MSDHLTKLREQMEAVGLDLVLLTEPMDVAYVSGFRFDPFEHIAVLCVPLDENVRFLLPGYEEAGVARAVPDETELFMFPEVGVDTEAFEDCMSGLAHHARIGVTASTIPVTAQERLMRALNRDSFHDCSELLGSLRAVKDDEEIALIAEASRIGDRAVERMIDESLCVGAVEAELGGDLSRILRYEGADGSAFEPGLTAGWRSALPHGPDHSRARGNRPGQDAIDSGELLVFDFSVVVGGYIADLSRTYVLGESEPKQREIFEIVQEAQQAAIDACIPGNPVGDVDRVAKQIIANAGYGECSPQKTGHGVGLELHELPYVAATTDQVLETGMIFCIEPAIYLEGYGGARVEDVVLVTDDGPRVLTDRTNQKQLELPVT